MSDNINAIVYSDQDKFDQAENNVREADANIESGVTEIALVRLSVLQFPRHLLYPRHETNNRLLLLFRRSCVTFAGLPIPSIVSQEDLHYCHHCDRHSHHYHPQYTRRTWSTQAPAKAVSFSSVKRCSRSSWADLSPELLPCLQTLF